VDKQWHLRNKGPPRSIPRWCLRSKFDHTESWRWSMTIHSSCSFRLDLAEEETEEKLEVESVEVEWVRLNKVRTDIRLRSKRLLFRTILQRNSNRLGSRLQRMLLRQSLRRTAIVPRRQQRWKEGGRRGLVASLKLYEATAAAADAKSFFNSIYDE
jgi:hypothetical protein